MFCSSRTIASAARNACGMTRRRLALSSSVRSIHCTAAVAAALDCKLMIKRASPQTRSQRMGAVLDLSQVERQIVSPQAGPLAHRRRLCRLQVRVTQASEVAMLLGEAAKLINYCGQAAGQKLQALAHQNQVSVIRDVT